MHRRLSLVLLSLITLLCVDVYMSIHIHGLSDMYRTYLVYRYNPHALAYYIAYRNGSFAFNNYGLDQVEVIVNITEVKDDIAFVEVYIRGMLVHYEIGEGGADVPYFMWEQPGDYRRSIITLEEDLGYVEHKLKFKVDRKTNYAWLDDLFIGFFPFYIFPAIGYRNASEYTKYVYLGEKLHLTEKRGIVVPCTIELETNGESHRTSGLCFHNRYLDIAFIYHYVTMIYYLVLPINRTTYIEFYSPLYLEIDKDFAEYLVSISDYPRTVTYIVWERLLIIVPVFAAIVFIPSYIVYKVMKKRKRR